jgi:hypothetical protein
VAIVLLGVVVLGLVVRLSIVLVNRCFVLALASSASRADADADRAST